MTAGLNDNIGSMSEKARWGNWVLKVLESMPLYFTDLNYRLLCRKESTKFNRVSRIPFKDK